MNNSIEVGLFRTVHRKRKNEQKKNVLSEVFYDYCKNTTIHGIKYLGANDKSYLEKIWWITVVIISIICCCYLISRTWIKWKNNPVIISFEQEQFSVWKIPFPAVTICPLNKVEQPRYDYTAEFRKRNELEGEKIWWITVVIISIICCCYLISRTWIKWKNNPVIISFEQEQFSVWKIPFPAVTICPLNKVEQPRYDYTAEFRKRNELEGEKIWWITVVIISIICCCYLISRTWIKWKNNPVIISFEQEQFSVWKIPFPAVTICPLNKVEQPRYDYTAEFRKRNELEGEKIWWITVVIISIICCCYLISRTWIKWKNNPVIISFEQEQFSVWKIPFPAVTICPLNKVEQPRYDYTAEFRKRNELEGENYTRFWDISLVCNLEHFEIKFNSSPNITDYNAIDNIRNVVSKFNIVSTELYWQGKKLDTKYFAEQITQEGLCFTFNSLSQEDMYTKELNHKITYIKHSMKNAGWTLEDGYPSDSFSLDDHPRRTAKDGSGSGLRITMIHFIYNNDYTCSPIISGYKITLHNPAEIPRPTQQYFLAPLNKHSVLRVKPEVTTTSANLRSTSPSVRKCYFSDEKSLRFFRVYTQSNCRIECIVNVTQNICKCLPFYMPSEKETPICGFAKMNCVFEAEVKILKFEMLQKGVNKSSKVREREPYKIFDKCNCLQSCSDLKFSAETSHTKSNIVLAWAVSGLKDGAGPEVIEQLLIDGVVSITQVDIFFKETQFLALHRSELYGQTDFLANCGGLMELFIGFSLFSFIEIFYFLTIGLWTKWKNIRGKF